MRFVLAAILVSISTASLANDDRDALCRSISRELVEVVGLKFDKVTGIRPVYWFSSPDAEWVAIDCEDKFPVAIFSAASPFPSDHFYNLAGRVASIISGVRSDVASYSFKQCQKRALEESSSITHVRAGKVSLGCKASMKKGTTLSVTTVD